MLGTPFENYENLEAMVSLQTSDCFGNPRLANTGRSGVDGLEVGSKGIAKAFTPPKWARIYQAP